MWFDTHCHWLDSAFDADRALCFAAAQAVGVSATLIPSVTPADWSAITTFCRTHSTCYPAYGIHPYAATEIIDDHQLINYLSMPTSVAIGEIGLDGRLDKATFAAQEHCFITQLKLAQQFDLPVILHLNHAIDAGLKYLRRYRVRGGIVHAFNGSLQQAQQLIDLGFALGIGGVASYPRAEKIRRVLCALPLGSLVLETDAPYLPPVWAKKTRHLPQELPRLGETIAQLRGITPAELAQVTMTTALRCLPRVAVH